MWTDEKHGLYLASLEASFVNNQLHHSIRLRGWLGEMGGRPCSSPHQVRGSLILVFQISNSPVHKLYFVVLCASWLCFSSWFFEIVFGRRKGMSHCWKVQPILILSRTLLRRCVIWRLQETSVMLHTMIFKGTVYIVVGGFMQERMQLSLVDWQEVQNNTLCAAYVIRIILAAL